MNPESWFLIGHIVCISQWCAFIMVDYAYLGKGRVRPLWLWTTVLVAGELFLGIKLNIGFFTLLSSSTAPCVCWRKIPSGMWLRGRRIPRF